MRLLATEVDKRLDAALRRSAGFDTKAGFILTASGLVAGSSAVTASVSTVPALASIPISLALLGIGAAMWALWTRSIDVPDARKIVDDFVDQPVAPERLEDVLLEVRTKEVEARENHNTSRAKAVTVGFVMLAAAVSALLIFVLVARQVAPVGELNGTPTPTPAAIE
ncbi:hypothetical protein SD72_16600 [Leucobacter komagatae]|uniref:Uncharacterized protein n=1 Tax=Leucobacter komagatae TaxID=55969 RepID=A0A0D0IHT3_9MICO|nr:hypothetical protein SD72_16600 [Leucobacter komagatae]